MSARIYKPARSTTQSGMARTKHWVLEFAPESRREVDPLMGWTSSGDTQAQVRLRFDSKKAALSWAKTFEGLGEDDQYTYLEELAPSLNRMHLQFLQGILGFE